jgi:tetratricopeptide (TPR) repeat protein
MKHPVQKRLHFVGVLATLMALFLSASAYGGGDGRGRGLIVGPDDEIYGTQEAADLVAEARRFDPMFCPREQADRGEAVRLYEQAMAAQPEAKLNGPLADRIAQLYAFYEDKEKEVRPNRGEATQWWQRCLETTDQNQLLWAQAQMGLASLAVGGRDYTSAIEHYSAILDMDTSRIELPDWKVWPNGDTARGRAMLEQERTRLRESVEGIQIRAAEKQSYVVGHFSKDAAVRLLQQVAARHRGTAIGDQASKKIAVIRSQARKDPWALPQNFIEPYVPEAPSPVPPAGEQELPEVEVAVAAEPGALAVTEESHLNDWGLALGVVATMAAAMVVAGALWIRRRG